MNTSSAQSLIDRSGRCDTLSSLAPIITILVCLSLATVVMIYKLNALESIGAYVLLSLFMLLLTGIIAYTCAVYPRWAGHVGLVLVGGWALTLMYLNFYR